MSFDLALPIYAASAAALVAAATLVGRPRIRLRTSNQTIGGLRVVEIAFMLTRAGRRQVVEAADQSAAGTAAEFVIYMTLKTSRKTSRH